MQISAKIESRFHTQHTQVQTNDLARSLTMPVKPAGYGSAVNGGELLMLALATCFCNDIYREAGKRKIAVSAVEVECTADFGAEGEPGSNIQYTARVSADASPDVIEELIRATDQVAEIHNTLRQGVNVKLVQ
jgi:organic hydroperoxide reductase OsmC/OhrA